VAITIRRDSARAPEVLQTSEMDCGPAALAALLGAFGLGADLGALREVCATDVDGTSIDVLEEVAVGLGLDAEQVVVPWAQLRAVPQAYLPALMLTRTPGGLAHVVCAWRHRRGRLDLVDPAVGRRRVRWDALAEEVFMHELEAPAEAWEEYAFSTDARIALETRLRAGGASRDEARAEVEAALRDGALEAGVGGLLARLDEVEDGPSGPAGLTFCPGSNPGTVKVRGVVLVRAKRADDRTEVVATLRGVPAARRDRPLATLLRWIGLDRPRAALALATGLLAAIAGIGEVLLGRQVLEQGIGDGRLLTLAAVLAASILVGVAFSYQVAAIGRRVESGTVGDLLGRAGRFGEVFSRTRPAGDLAERTHALRQLRVAIELTGLGVQKGLELVLACGAMIALSPATWPAVVGLLALGVSAPTAIVRTLREADLRSRAQGGALAQLLTDVLGGADAIRAHRAAPVITAWQVPILAHWRTAATDLARRSILVTVLLSGPSLLLAVAATALAIAAGAGSPTAFAVLALGFTAAAGITDIAFSTRRLVSLRSVIARLLDALNAPLADPPPALAARGDGCGARLELREVDVVLGGVPVLAGFDLDLAAGEHVAVVGASGAGKSTLVALLGGWLTPASGAIWADGSPLEGASLARLRAATAWSDPTARLRDATAAENADEGRSPDAIPSAERLAAVGLDADLLGGGRVGEGGARLSDSEAQRLRLARALGRPDARLVLLDEALRGLPEGERRRLLARMRRVWAAATLVHVTHDPAEALEFDRVLVVAEGRLAEAGDPATLAARRGGSFRALLDARKGIRRRLEDRDRWEPARPAEASGDAFADPDTDVLAAESCAPRFASLLSASLGAALVSTGLLFLAAAALGNGLGAADPSGLSWLPEVVALLVGAAAVTALGLLADARLTVTVGDFLRRRVLAVQLAADPGRRRAEGIGAHLGRVLDLELVERAVQEAGAVLAVGIAELIGATVILILLLDPLAVVPVAAAIAGGAVVARQVAHNGGEENAARRGLATELLHLLLGYRAVTIFAGPADRDRATDGVERLRCFEARGDAARTLLVTVLPRLAALALLALLALEPTASGGETAAALGAILLALAGLERSALAVSDLAVAAPAWSEARPLLRPETAPGGPAASGGGRGTWAGALRRVRCDRPVGGVGRASIAPAPGEDVLFHRSLASNALVATRSWPPQEEQLDALEQTLEPLGLAAVVERMPSGLGQPLGETGWRLSEGERARFSLLRALLAGSGTVIADDTLSALDAETAHRVLDYLESLDREVIVRRRTA
jgi:ATP-binding cassette subfamily B protein